MKRIATLCIALSLSSMAQASASVDALFDGARQYLNDGRSTYSQGYFAGAVIARGYDSPACLDGKQTKVILTGVASILVSSPDLRNSVAPAPIIDHVLLQAFPCKVK